MDTMSKEARSRVMSKIKSKWTGPERALAQAMKRKRIKYAAHVPGVPGHPDFIVPGKRTLAVFVNGCFWHRHKSCPANAGRMPRSNVEFWRAKLNGNVKRDAALRKKLRRLGFATITVWECQVAKDVDAAADRVRRKAEK